MISVKSISRIIVFCLSLTVLFSFQNCNKVQFSTQLPEDVSSSDFCTANPDAAECLNVSPPTCSFNGTSYQEGQTVVAYLTSTVPYGQNCTEEVRTCSGGSFTGTYSFPACNVDTPAACLFNGQAVNHGSTVVAYQNSAVPFGTTCVSQNRQCNNGVLSGSYNFASCTVGAANSCLFNGQTIPHGQSVQAFTTSSVPYGQTCAATTRTCYNGQLTGSGNFASCMVDAPSACLFNGQTIAHQGSVTAYQNSTVPAGSTCVSQQRTCNNGVLSGTYNIASCTVSAPLSCMFNGQTVPHGQNVTAYQSSTVNFGQSCTSQVRSCNNGSLSGSYSYSSCVVNSAASCLFNGQTINHGQSVTAFPSSTVAYGQTCQPETRTCYNGTLSGSATFANCSVSGPVSCLLDGQTFAHNQQVVAYNSRTVPFGQTCSQRTRQCINGSFTEDASYQYLSCQAEAPKNCVFNGQTVLHGASRTAYFQSQVPYGQSCASQAQTRTCYNGTMSGSAPYASCTVLPQPCAAGETRNSAGVCVSTNTVTNTSSAAANKLCVDHNAYFQFQMVGNEISLWAWGTNPGGNVVGWNCADTVTPYYYQYLPPIKIWSQTFTKGYRPEIALSGSILGGGGCSPSGIGFSGYTRHAMIGLCPNHGAGTMQYSFTITITSRAYSGGIDGAPPYPPVYTPPTYYDGGGP